MSVSGTVSRQIFSANGTTSQFSWPYYVEQATDMKLVVVDESDWSFYVGTPGVNYNFLGAGTGSTGGTISTVGTYSSSITLIAYNEPSAIQDFEADPFGAYSAQATPIETRLDRLTIITQRLLSLAKERAVKLGDNIYQGFDLTLPRDLNDGSSSKNKVPLFDSTGTKFSSASLWPYGDAVGSANTAGSIAISAAGSASNSAAQAGSYAASASTSATSSLTQAGQAGSYAASASTSATSSLTQAGQAGSYAASASTSATSALTQAGQAGSYAASASTSATSALTQSGQAGSYAASASTSATNSSNSAGTANLAAGTANLAAGTANSAAGTANLAAGTANAAITSLLAAGGDTIYNLGLLVAATGSTCVVTMKDANGAAISTASAVKIPFRSLTGSAGTPTVVSVTAAIAATASIGSTLGFSSGSSSKLWFYATYNGTTAAMAMAGQRIFSDGELQTVTAEGGAGAADSVNVLYGPGTIASAAVKLLGYAKIANTGGTWTTAPTEVALQNNIPKQERSEIWLTTPNGHGTGAFTKYRRYSTTKNSVGTAFSYTDAANGGGSITANEDMLVSLLIIDRKEAGTTVFGASVNSSGTQGSASITTIAAANVLFFHDQALGLFIGCGQTTFRVAVGDVIRCHTDGTPDTTATNAQLHICKVGD